MKEGIIVAVHGEAVDVIDPHEDLIAIYIKFNDFKLTFIYP